MTELILPPHLKAVHRPYRTATSEALMQELMHRQELGELTAQHILTVQDLDLIEMDKGRAAVFQGMFAQMSQAIAQSGFAFTGSTNQADPINPALTQEVLVVKLLVARHPMIPRAT